MVNVHHEIRTLVLSFWGDRDMESNVTEIKGPATRHEPKDSVFALDGIGVCAGLHKWAELICICTRLDLEKPRSRLDNFPLARKPIEESRAVE